MTAFKRSILTFAITFCISMLVFSVTAWALMQKYFYNDISDDKSPIEALDETLNGEGDPSDVNEREQKVKGTSFTVLLVGNDYMGKGVAGHSSTSYADAILLLRFDCEAGNIVYLPIPSNMQVSEEGEIKTLAEVYNDTGSGSSSRDTTHLVSTVERILGVDIDHYVCTSLASGAFSRIVEKISDTDGFEYDVPRKMERDDPGFVDIAKGKNDLSGNEATSMLRYLGGTTSDDYYGRLDLTADFFHELISTANRRFSVSDIVSMYKEFCPEDGPSVKTDITNIDDPTVLSYIDTVLKYEEFGEPIMLRYPGSFETGTNKDGSTYKYFDPDEEKTVTLLDDYYNN